MLNRGGVEPRPHHETLNLLESAFAEILSVRIFSFNRLTIKFVMTVVPAAVNTVYTHIFDIVSDS